MKKLIIVGKNKLKEKKQAFFLKFHYLLTAEKERVNFKHQSVLLMNQLLFVYTSGKE